MIILKSWSSVVYSEVELHSKNSANRNSNRVQIKCRTLRQFLLNPLSLLFPSTLQLLGLSLPDPPQYPLQSTPNHLSRLNPGPSAALGVRSHGK